MTAEIEMFNSRVGNEDERCKLIALEYMMGHDPTVASGAVDGGGGGGAVVLAEVLVTVLPSGKLSCYLNSVVKKGLLFSNTPYGKRSGLVTSRL